MAAKNQKHVDIENWLKKVKLTKLALAQAISKAVTFGMDKVYSEADKNLKGPHYLPPARIPEIGTMPIPRVSSQLSKSLTLLRLSPTVGAIFSDQRKCIYNKKVHDGGTFYGKKKDGSKGKAYYIKPRRYLGSVVTIWRPRIQIEMKHQIIAAIRKEGQK